MEKSSIYEKTSSETRTKKYNLGNIVIPLTAAMRVAELAVEKRFDAKADLYTVEFNLLDEIATIRETATGNMVSVVSLWTE